MNNFFIALIFFAITAHSKQEFLCHVKHDRFGVGTVYFDNNVKKMFPEIKSSSDFYTTVSYIFFNENADTSATIDRVIQYRLTNGEWFFRDYSYILHVIGREPFDLENEIGSRWLPVRSRETIYFSVLERSLNIFSTRLPNG